MADECCSRGARFTTEAAYWGISITHPQPDFGLPSSYLGDLLVGVSSTLYLSGARTCERTSRLGWVVALLKVGLVILDYLHIAGTFCNNVPSDAG